MCSGFLLKISQKSCSKISGFHLYWCPEEDSNLHTFRHTDLNRARLPIPPSGHFRKKENCIKNISQTSGLLDEVEGTVQGHRDGHGFVLRNDGEPDIYLPPNEMRAVLHKDRIKLRIVRSDRKGRPEGRVLEIIERSNQPIIGRLLLESGIWIVVPEDKCYGQDILIPKAATGLAKSGQVVVVELTEPPALYGQPVGRVKEILGEVDDPGIEIEIAVRKFSVPYEFSDACIALARTLPDTVRAQDKKRRVDLTDVPLVTIDSEDARDFDDAVYCEPAKIGKGKSAVQGWRLLVAIADVSHYVENGSAIDIDAYERATSVCIFRVVSFPCCRRSCPTACVRSTRKWNVCAWCATCW